MSAIGSRTPIRPWLLDDGSLHSLVPIIPLLLEEVGVKGLSVQIWFAFITAFNTVGELAGEAVSGWRQQNHRHSSKFILLRSLAEVCVVMLIASVTCPYQLLGLGLVLGSLSAASSSNGAYRNIALARSVGTSLPMAVGYAYDSVAATPFKKAIISCGIVAIFRLWTSLCRKRSEHEEEAYVTAGENRVRPYDSLRQQSDGDSSGESWEETGGYGLALAWSCLVPIVAGGGRHHADLRYRATRIGTAIAWKTAVATFLAPHLYDALRARLYEHGILQLARTGGLANLWYLQFWWEKFTKDGDVAKRNVLSYVLLTFAPTVFYCIQNALPASQITTPIATPAVGKAARRSIRLLVPFTVLLCHAMAQAIDDKGGFCVIMQCACLVYGYGAFSRIRAFLGRVWQIVVRSQVSNRT